MSGILLAILLAGMVVFVLVTQCRHFFNLWGQIRDTTYEECVSMLERITEYLRGDRMS